MKNIEIKVGVDDFAPIKVILENNGIRQTQVLDQVDTYFESDNSRLKLRGINGKKFVLIGYKRPGDGQLK